MRSNNRATEYFVACDLRRARRSKWNRTLTSHIDSSFCTCIVA